MKEFFCCLNCRYLLDDISRNRSKVRLVIFDVRTAIGDSKATLKIQLKMEVSGIPHMKWSKAFRFSVSKKKKKKQKHLFVVTLRNVTPKNYMFFFLVSWKTRNVKQFHKHLQKTNKFNCYTVYIVFNIHQRLCSVGWQNYNSINIKNT